MHPSLSRLHRLRPADPLVRWMVDPAKDDLSISEHLVADGANVAWRGRATRPGENWVTGLGEDPDAVVALIVGLAETGQVDGVTVPEAAFDLLPPALRSPDPGHWCLWTLAPADVRDDVGREGATILVAADDPRIRPLLGHSDSAHIFPGDPRIVQWVGVEDGQDLVSVAAMLTEPSGAAHIVSVCTAPAYRGRGLARQTCGALVRGAVDAGAPMIALEMYTANEAGRRTYSALGFAEVGRYVSGLLAHALPPR